MIGILLLTATDAAQKAVLEGVAVSVVATAQFGAEAHLKDKNQGEVPENGNSPFFLRGNKTEYHLLSLPCP